MQYWLMKTEPSTFGLHHLQQKPNQTAYWDGVRNYQARNMLRDQMKRGDLALLYHSNCSPPGIAAVVEIVREGYVDFTAFDPKSHYYDPKSDPTHPRWFMVDIKLVNVFERFIPLTELRMQPGLEELVILRKGNRLSITPVTRAQWDIIINL